MSKEIENQLENINENLDVLNNQLLDITKILKHANGIEQYEG